MYYASGPSLSAILTLAFVSGIGCIRFNLHPATRRCLKEEMRKGIVVSGDYDVTPVQGSLNVPNLVRVDLAITDSKGHVAFARENIDKGRFAVTPDEDDIYDYCVISHPLVNIPPPQLESAVREVLIIMKHGVEAKNYEQLAAVSQLKPLELELTKLEDLSSSIVQDFEYMKQREQEMRDTNESTNNRVFYLSLFSMSCLAALALWQILYLKKFFKSKKLIE